MGLSETMELYSVSKDKDKESRKTVGVCELLGLSAVDLKSARTDRLETDKINEFRDLFLILDEHLKL